MASGFSAFIDESSAYRGGEHQEYLVCAALVPFAEADEIRSQLKPLLLPGQKKLHWTDESDSRRRRIIDCVAELGQMSAIVSHVSQRQKKTERFRRKCLEQLYFELIAMDVGEIVCEARTEAQDKKDLAHVVALRNHKVVPSGFRIDHCKGGDEPLLWLPDVFLGAVNSAHLGQGAFLDQLREQIVFEAKTPDSLSVTLASEKP